MPLPPILAGLRADPTLAPLHRSLDVYYGDPVRDAAMDRLYGRFLRPGDLAFDVGSHVGDRIASFRRLGARVVALEPQPDCARVIRALYGGDPYVTLVEAACGPEEGRLTLHVNSANPTVTTGSPEFVRAAEGQAGWEGQVWDRSMEVPVTTLDALIAEHGVPAFVKIDVEGFEEAVLAGLSRPLPALSFELTTIQKDVACRCLERLACLPSTGATSGEASGAGSRWALPSPSLLGVRGGYVGAEPGARPLTRHGAASDTVSASPQGVRRSRATLYLFNIALGESQRLTFEDWVSADEMAAHIRALPHEANSGDVYAIATVSG